MRLASITERIAPVSERLYDRASNAGEAVSEGAQVAYRAALNHPKTSIGGLILAAGLVAGVLWYVFGDWQRPASRRGTATRVRAGTRSAHRRRAKGARAAAAG
jgi:pimeloyl-ACP methyl ester carboxylesterase